MSCGRGAVPDSSRKRMCVANKDHEPSQIDKFRDMARELECDDDEAAFDERLRQIAPKEPDPKDDKA